MEEEIFIPAWSDLELLVAGDMIEQGLDPTEPASVDLFFDWLYEQIEEGTD